MVASGRAWWGGWLLVLLGFVGLGGAGGPSAGAEEPAPASLVDWLKERREDASFEARARLYRERVGPEAYTGSSEQNSRLLQVLRGGGLKPAPREAPRPPGVPEVRRQVEVGGLKVLYDLSTLVLQLELPEDVRFEGDGWQVRTPKPERVEDAAIFPRLPVEQLGFVSAAVLAQKAKQFDDGLYAAVELAVQAGPQGKGALLQRLRERLNAAGARDEAAQVVEAAARLGAVDGPGVQGIEREVRTRLAKFQATAERSKPLGFYTWSKALARIFQQDRMLQSPLHEPGLLLGALRADPLAQEAYRRLLGLYEGLTNPYVGSDLRPWLDAPSSALPAGGVYLLPPSRAHETDLAKLLWGASGVPEGANLFDELIRAVRAGTVSLEPSASSGWYDRQTWALEPLLRPELTPEARHLDLGPRYRDHLAKLFKGLLALTRETHVKQLEGPSITSPAPPRRWPIHVRLPFTLEPLPTHYERRAEAYAFVRGVLTKHLGPDGLASLKRLTAEGPVALGLAAELEQMESLMRGAAETSRAELGLPPGTEAAATAALESWTRWRAGLATDPDLARDARMMVPVFYDLERRKTKVWVFLGWTRQALEAAIKTPPQLLESTPLVALPTWDGNVFFHVEAGEIHAPVVAEVYVTQLLDRAEFRAHCDRFKTRSAILTNLR